MDKKKGNDNDNFLDAFEDDNVNNSISEENSFDSSEIEIEIPSINIENSNNEVPDGLEVFEDSNSNIQNPIEFSTKEDEKKEIVEPFDTNKISADAAMNVDKPPVLNRNLIISVISGVCILFIIFSVFIFPFITQKKITNDKTKPVAEENAITDYSALVDKDSNQSMSPFDIIDEKIQQTLEESEKKLNFKENANNTPPIADAYKPKDSSNPQQLQQNNNNVTYSSTNNAREIPDTSRDPLQAKSISGIKGISNTQKNYLTNPEYLDNYNQSTSANIQSTDSSNPYSKFGLPDKNTYMQQMLASAGQGSTGQVLNNNSSENTYINQNDQSGKNQFYSTNRGNVSGTWIPLNTIWQGSIFEAVLTSNINTDLPGECTAVITKNVYSSQDGSVLLIPMNSKLFGSYNSSISYSQRRIQVGWHTLIRPDGYQQSLGNMIATDAQGASGIKGFLNDHPFQYLKALALMSAFNIISTEFNNLSDTNKNQYVQNIAANSQNIANTLGSKLIDRAMDVQPTISIGSGTKINIVANTNLTLPPLDDYPVTEAYHRY